MVYSVALCIGLKVRFWSMMIKLFWKRESRPIWWHQCRLLITSYFFFHSSHVWLMDMTTSFLNVSSKRYLGLAEMCTFCHWLFYEPRHGGCKCYIRISSANWRIKHKQLYTRLYIGSARTSAYSYICAYMPTYSRHLWIPALMMLHHRPQALFPTLTTHVQSSSVLALFIIISSFSFYSFQVGQLVVLNGKKGEEGARRTFMVAISRIVITHALTCGVLRSRKRFIKSRGPLLIKGWGQVSSPMQWLLAYNVLKPNIAKFPTSQNPLTTVRYLRKN